MDHEYEEPVYEDRNDYGKLEPAFKLASAPKLEVYREPRSEPTPEVRFDPEPKGQDRGQVEGAVPMVVFALGFGFGALAGWLFGPWWAVALTTALAIMCGSLLKAAEGP